MLLGVFYAVITKVATNLLDGFLSMYCAIALRQPLGLRRDPHRYVKQVHHEELEDGEKERPSPFPKIMLKQTDSGIQ